LLERDADRVGNIRLAHSQKNSAGTYLLPDVGVYRGSHSAAYRPRHVGSLSFNEIPGLHNLVAASKGIANAIFRLGIRPMSLRSASTACFVSTLVKRRGFCAGEARSRSNCY
jgi:hypothetical protein